MFAALGATALLAAVSSLHCAAMCGPLASCASRNKPALALRYHVGRIAGYAVLGAFAGALGSLAPAPLSRWVAAITAWLAAAVLLAAAHRSWSRERRPLVTLRRSRPIAARRSRLAGLLSRWVAARPGLSGSLTALLPCGVLWAALAIAASSGSPIGGAVAMAVFAALTAISISVGALLLAAVNRGAGSKSLAIVFALAALMFAVLPLPQLVSGDDAANARPAECPLHGVAPR